jgi:hypothetical protein
VRAREEKKGNRADQRGPAVRTNEPVCAGRLPGASGTEMRERTGTRAALGELTGVAATGGEGAGRLRGFFSATLERKKVGESFGAPGTGGALRSGRGRRA